MKTVENVVIGGGIAGVSTAESLGAAGEEVLLVERRDQAMGKALFINGAQLPEDMFDAMRLQGAFHPITRLELIDYYNGGTVVGGEASSEQLQTGLIDYEPALDYVRSQLGFAAVSTLRDNFESAAETSGGVEIQLACSGIVKAKRLIDAGGWRAPVLRQTRTIEHRPVLDERDTNPRLLWMYGRRATGKFPEDCMFEPISHEMGLVWIMPRGDGTAEVLTSEYCRQSELAQQAKRERFNNVLHWISQRDDMQIDELVGPVFAGAIKVEPISHLSGARANHTYAVGDSAGMADPMMAELFTPALHWGHRLGQMITAGAAPYDYYRTWRDLEPLFAYDYAAATLDRRDRKHAEGKRGTSSALYEIAIQHLNQDQLQRLLLERKLSASMLFSAALPMLKRARQLAPVAADIVKYYAMRRARTLIERARVAVAS